MMYFRALYATRYYNVPAQSRCKFWLHQEDGSVLRVGKIYSQRRLDKFTAESDYRQFPLKRFTRRAA